MIHTCSECHNDFKPDFPYGDDIQCPHCNVWLATEFEQLNYENMANWVTGKANDQRITTMMDDAWEWLNNSCHGCNGLDIAHDVEVLPTEECEDTCAAMYIIENCAYKMKSDN